MSTHYSNLAYQFSTVCNNRYMHVTVSFKSPFSEFGLVSLLIFPGWFFVPNSNLDFVFKIKSLTTRTHLCTGVNILPQNIFFLKISILLFFSIAERENSWRPKYRNSSHTNIDKYLPLLMSTLPARGNCLITKQKPRWTRRFETYCWGFSNWGWNNRMLCPCS